MTQEIVVFLLVGTCIAHGSREDILLGGGCPQIHKMERATNSLKAHGKSV